MWKIFILLSDESATNTDEIWNFSKHIFQLSILKSFQLLIGHFYNLQHILEMWRVDIIQSHLTPRPLIFFHKAYSMAWLPLSLVKVSLCQLEKLVAVSLFSGLVSDVMSDTPMYWGNIRKKLHLTSQAAPSQVKI